MKQTLIDLLKKASDLCVDNLDKAHNIDLHQMYEDLDSMIDQLNEIEDFEIYDEQVRLSGFNNIYLEC